ncbi:MAG: phage holin family protein [Anaerolineales bacterium]
MQNSWIVRLAVNAVGLYAAIALIPGLRVVDENWVTYLWLALFFGIVNALIRPIIKLLTCPFYILTLGLFSLIVNTIMFYITAWLSRLFGVELVISDFWAAFLGALVVSLVSVALNAVLPDDNARPRSSVKRPQ